MSSTKTCISLASQDPRWKNFDDATKSAIAIAFDLGDRRGLGIDDLDDETKNEIIDSWADIIRTIHSKD